MENKKKLKFAIMLNSLSLQKWQYNILENLISSGIADIKLFIFNDKTEEIKKRTIFNYPWSRFFYRFYRRYFYKPNLTDNIDIDIKKYASNHINCKTITKNKYSEYFCDNDIDAINSYDLDFILRFGFNIIRGDILETAKYGVWSFHHGNPEKYRGGPPVFWELLKKENSVGFILQKLTNKLDAGEILFKGEINVSKHSYTETVDRILDISTVIPQKICREILENNLSVKPVNTLGKIYKYPRNFTFIFFAASMLKNKIAFHYNQLFKVEQWNVGVIEQSPNMFFKNNMLADINWLDNPKAGTYYADPFFLNNKPIFEFYSYKKQKGVIAQINQNCVKEIISQDHHLSYPFTINYNNKNYIMPEAYASKQLDLYNVENKISEFTFLKGKEIVDPTLFLYNNIYWLWFSTKDFANENLELWFADSLDGDFKAHPMNPLKVNSVGSRPAGTPFILNNKLIRPAQNCKATYGASVVFWEVSTISKTDYKEEFFDQLKPLKKSKWNKGLHTFSVNQDMDKILIDGKRYTFSWSNFTNIFKKKMHF